MRVMFLTVLAGFAAASATAMAQPASSSPPPRPHEAATLCLDGLGINHAPICTKHLASRFPAPPDICQCEGPYRRVEAPWCAKGEKPPADTAAFDRARAKAARDGSLFGDAYRGKRMCVPLDD